MKASDIVGWGDDGDTEAEAVRNLALAFEDVYDKNQPTVHRLFKAQIWATSSFCAAVTLLAVRTLGI